MSFSERIRRIPAVAWAGLFAVALLLPSIGSTGFWDPWELTLAERARDMGRLGALTDPTLHGRYAAEPPLHLALAALGMKVFGPGEFGARLGNVALALLTLAGVYWGASGLLRRRAALLSVVVLGTMPMFFMQARQLVSSMPLIAGLTLALAGLGRYAWPANGTRRARDLLVAVAGLLIGVAGGGVLLGFALPTLTLAGALLVCGGLRPELTDPVPPVHALSSSGVGSDFPAGDTLARSLFARGRRGRVWLWLLLVGGVLALLVTFAGGQVAGKYSAWLGGVPRAGTPEKTFEYLIRQIGFGVFPWSAIAIFALGRGLLRVGGIETDSHARLAFVGSFFLVAASFGFALSSVFVLLTGDGRFCVLAPLAWAVGAFLDEALEAETAEPVVGLLAATGTAVVARDLYLSPDTLLTSYLLVPVKWPSTVSIGYPLLAVGLLVGLALYAGLAARGRALGKVVGADSSASPRWFRKVETVAIASGRWGVEAALAVALVFAFGVIYGLVPTLTHHFSFKPVFDTYARFARNGEPIGRYRVESHGASFYGREDMVELRTQPELVSFLGRSSRVFALVSADELAALDAALKTARVNYAVVDASSSRYLLLSNQVGQGQEDQNPLRRNVWLASRAPDPSNGGWDWHGEKPPWTWQTPVAYTYEDAIELVGVTYPDQVRRPGKIVMTLYWRVNRKPPSGYRVFVHFDTPGQPRLNGDHTPVGGTFPLTYWIPGEYIRDEITVDVPLMTTPAGTYTIYVGWWPGGDGKRLHITSGQHQADRALVGTMEIH